MEAEIYTTSDDELPFAYFNPNNMLVYWMCNYDEENRLVSVFYGRNKKSDPEDRRVAVCGSLQDAIEQRDALIIAGWRKLAPPKVKFVTDEKPKTTRERLKKKLYDKMTNNPETTKP
uniref:Uncharacterized protein n=1 Tax=viral metagenome TaxID=1070528 RepID=A0A6C0M2L0_9ZZZZ